MRCRAQALPTPALLVDEAVVQQNCRDMLRKAQTAGVNLRPHVKTHKCRAIARMQVGGDLSRGILASTLPEVRFMAADGFTDITLGVPVTASKIAPLLKICSAFPATRVSIFVDSAEIVDTIEALHKTESKQRGTLFGCFLKIDVGYHRAGVDVQQHEAEGVALARKLHDSGALEFRGIYSHSGNAYTAASKTEAKAICTLECERAKQFADALAAAQIPCPTVSIGSTPACAAADDFPGATEIHPGNYVFFDRQQMAVSVCGAGQVAVRVLTRVLVCLLQKVAAVSCALTKKSLLYPQSIESLCDKTEEFQDAIVCRGVYAYEISDKFARALMCVLCRCVPTSASVRLCVSLSLCLSVSLSLCLSVCFSKSLCLCVCQQGHYADHLLCDTGSLAISKDLAPQDHSYGVVEGTDLLLSSVSQVGLSFCTCVCLYSCSDLSIYNVYWTYQYGSW